MKKFTITESRPAIQYWTYEVEAENEEEALHKVMNGDVDPIDSDYELDSYEEPSYEVIDEQ